MDKLIDGVFKFQSGEFYPRRNFFRELAKGQSPEVLFITCSDSRINPHMLTQTEPGELFVLRNAGNVVPAHGTGSGGEEGSIEYAVSVLGVEHIIVCGHSQCGAMKGLLHPQEVQKKLPAVSKWLEHAEATRCLFEHKCGHLGDEECIQEASKENVLGLTTSNGALSAQDGIYVMVVSLPENNPHGPKPDRINIANATVGSAYQGS